jgi:predicted RNA-binding Zn-ribbon protein involved in translation (DUF1610 family)
MKKRKKPVLCPVCDIEAEPYYNYGTIFKCPECGQLLTTVSGGEVEIYRSAADGEPDGLMEKEEY